LSGFLAGLTALILLMGVFIRTAYILMECIDADEE